MKKVLLALIAAFSLMACTSTTSGDALEQKYSIDKAAAKQWDQTIIRVITGEAYIPEWYGNDNPIMYLRKTGKMSEKDFNFLMSLSNAQTISDEDYENFVDLVEKYVRKIPRKFYLENHNLKDPKGLVDTMVKESFLKMTTPSSHIKTNVATPEEWEEIVAFSKQTDLSEKDTKKLRKLLNKFIKRDEFYDERAWYNKEISERTIQLTNLAAKKDNSSREMNNINAKALFVAYPQYFSTLDKWDD